MATITISYDGRNKIAKSVVELIRSLDVFKVLETKSEEKDPSLLTKEEFFAKIERAEQQAERGEGIAMLPGEDLTHFLTRNGYAI